MICDRDGTGHERVVHGTVGQQAQQGGQPRQRPGTHLTANGTEHSGPDNRTQRHLRVIEDGPCKGDLSPQLTHVPCPEQPDRTSDGRAKDESRSQE